MKGSTIGILVFGGIAYAAYRSWNIQKSVTMFEYSFSHVSVRMSGLTPVVTFSLNIYNPNKTGVPVDNILGEVFYSKQKIASFKNIDSIKLAGNEAKSIQMQARINLFNVASSLLNKTGDKTVMFGGLLKTPFFDLPFNYSQKLSATVSGIEDEAEEIGSIFQKMLHRHGITAEQRKAIMKRIKDRFHHRHMHDSHFAHTNFKYGQAL
ncbi:MAG: hypothetical protein EKK37_17380 [Sphingobacteriales bacterium]|nr:MAG: hypothetical protein EKK37_17380 [Sphingobacteriales bacterium]